MEHPPLLAGVLSGLEAAQPFFANLLPPLPYALLALVVTAAALVARLVAQKDLRE